MKDQGVNQTTVRIDRLQWRPDEFGRADRDLYFVSLYAGSVQHIPTHPEKTGETWRGWVQTSADADEVGWFHTEDEAKAAVLGAVWKAINE